MDKHFSMWLIICLLSIVSFCLKQNNVSTVFTMLYTATFLLPSSLSVLGKSGGIVLPVESVPCLVLTAVQTGITP